MRKFLLGLMFISCNVFADISNTSWIGNMIGTNSTSWQIQGTLILRIYDNQFVGYGYYNENGKGCLTKSQSWTGIVNKLNNKLYILTTNTLHTKYLLVLNSKNSGVLSLLTSNDYTTELNSISKVNNNSINLLENELKQLECKV